MRGCSRLANSPVDRRHLSRHYRQIAGSSACDVACQNQRLAEVVSFLGALAVAVDQRTNSCGSSNRATDYKTKPSGEGWSCRVQRSSSLLGILRSVSGRVCTLGHGTQAFTCRFSSIGCRFRTSTNTLKRLTYRTNGPTNTEDGFDLAAQHIKRWSDAAERILDLPALLQQNQQRALPRDDAGENVGKLLGQLLQRLLSLSRR